MRPFVVSLILYIFASAFFLSFSQNINDEIDLFKPDLVKLNQRTFSAVNDLRKEKKRHLLTWDEVLYRAAKDHADYLINQTRLSHTQKILEKETPLHRVKLHGGLSYQLVAENVVESPLGVAINIKGKKGSTVTYRAAGFALAETWRHSTGHYRNIIDGRFNASALATAYDSKTKRLVAVQVFGFTNIFLTDEEQTDYSAQLLTSQRQKLPYRLKDSQQLSRRARRAVQSFMKLKIDRDHLVGSFRQAKRAFRGRRSGIAQEYIALTQFDSSSVVYNRVRNRRNATHALTGALTKPVYRYKLLKYSRQNTRRAVFINLGIIQIKKRTRQFLYPLHSNEYGQEYNLALIDKRKLQTFRTHINIPSQLFRTPLPALQLANSFEDVKITPQFRIEEKYDTVVIKVYYPATAVEISAEQHNEITKTVETVDGKIVSLEASAFASVEGSEKDNRLLAQQRLEHFIAIIRPYLDTASVKPSTITNEQWDMFHRQIIEHELSALKSLSKADLRRFVNQHKNDSTFLTLLNEQRYTFFKLITKKTKSIPLQGQSATEKYYKLKREVEGKQRPSNSQLTALENAQLVAYYELMTSRTQASLDVIKSERYPAFQYHDLLFRYLVQKSVTNEGLYKGLHEFGRSKYFPSRLRTQLTYNNLVLIYQQLINNKLSLPVDTTQLFCTKYRQSEFLLRNYKKINCSKESLSHVDRYYILKELPSLISVAKSAKVKDFPADSVWRFYYLSTIEALYPEIPLPAVIYTPLRNIKKHFHPDNALLTEEERIRLAYFYAAFSWFDVARQLLDPLMNNPSPNPQGYKLYICLQAETFKDKNDFTEYLISQFDKLGKDEWCDLWFNPAYLNFLLLEDLKLKKFYNCKCDR